MVGDHDLKAIKAFIPHPNCQEVFMHGNLMLEGQLGSTVASSTSHGGLVCIARPITTAGSAEGEISSTRSTPSLGHTDRMGVNLSGPELQQENTFFGICHILQKKCSFIIDSGSSCNIIRESLISELGLSWGDLPSPVSFTLTQRVEASKVAWVPFCMPNYGDCMQFVALENPPADLVLGRKWASDVRAVHHCYENQYKFQKNGIDITLSPLPPSQVAELLTSGV